MKTFKDLEFKEHPVTMFFSGQARLNFDNNYGVSVVKGKGAYSTKKNPYELAVLYKSELCYTTPITDDVEGYLSESDVTELMKQVQLLKDKEIMKNEGHQLRMRKVYKRMRLIENITTIVISLIIGSLITWLIV